MEKFILVILLSILVNFLMISMGISLIVRCVVCGLIGLLGGLYNIKG